MDQSALSPKHLSSTDTSIPPPSYELSSHNNVTTQPVRRPKSYRPLPPVPGARPRQPSLLRPSSPPLAPHRPASEVPSPSGSRPVSISIDYSLSAASSIIESLNSRDSREITAPQIQDTGSTHDLIGARRPSIPDQNSIAGDTFGRPPYNPRYTPDLPVGVAPPSFLGQNSAAQLKASIPDNASMRSQGSSLYHGSPDILHPVHVSMINGLPLSHSPLSSMIGSPPTSPLSQSSGFPHFEPSQYTSPPSTVPTSHNSHDSFIFESSSGHDQSPDDYARVLQSVGQFPLEMVEERSDYNNTDAESLGDDDPLRYADWALLSHIAVGLRDKVPRGVHVKGSVPYPNAFTGKDIVSAIHSQIQRELVMHLGGAPDDRRAALHVARSLQSQLFFYEVEWKSRLLQDGVEDVYMFMNSEGGDAPIEGGELPTGIVTYMTRCYALDCGGASCYSYSCPRKSGLFLQQLPDPSEGAPEPSADVWSENVPGEVIQSLAESEVKRQTIIHTLITSEEQYLKDLDMVENVYMKPLQRANPPVISPLDLEEFIDQVFHNISDLRECSRRLLDVLHVRQREQYPIIERIGDVFLDAATVFRLAYPEYVGHHPIAEKRVKEELEKNAEFRMFIERCSRQRMQEGTRLLDLKHSLSRPAEHLQKYPVLLEAIVNETPKRNPDRDFLQEAIDAIKSLQQVAMLRTFQSAMCKGYTAKWEYNDLVTREMVKGLSKDEIKRQSIIFELIKGEMAYVRDLELVENLYVEPLRTADPSIIPSDRQEQFLRDAFCNISELFAHHKRLLDRLHEIQREEHPRIRSITAPLFDATLNFREAYMEYITNYPIGEYRIDDEKAHNSLFKLFYDQCLRHADTRRLDMKHFIYRPIPRLLRYELLLRNIQEETPPMHDDRDAIPQVIEVIKALGKDSEPGVQSAKLKVQVWRYNSNLVFKPGEYIDMDLLNDQRSIVHSGKLLRQPEGGLNTWMEVFVLLFDNYLVLTKARERDGINQYHVIRRPIPLDLLMVYNMHDPPIARGTGILRSLRSGETQMQDGSDSRNAYPMTFLQTGRSGGVLTLCAESVASREDWNMKLEEALGLRKVVQESNKVFEIETLNTNTFFTHQNNPGQSWQDHSISGPVTCSVPFTTTDGRALIAVGCVDGLWMGFRHDSRSMQRVLHIKRVTQCDMLEEFSVFLVLADKVLFAYHIEALVPSNPSMPQPPQKMNTIVHKDVQFFKCGKLNGRTLVVFVKKDGSNSVFYVVEPVLDKIHERNKASNGLALRLLGTKSSWFRDYRRFGYSSEAYDVAFLKAKLAILSARGFEILDATDFQTIVSVPLKDEPQTAHISKRCESSRPIGIFRSSANDFLLCFEEFGLYVNKKGHPSNPSTGTIEWEGKVERVAIHAPYILLFDRQFIEVRHIKTGRLAQIIPGNEIRCIWNGLGVDYDAIISPSGEDEQFVSEPRVYAVMNVEEPQGMYPNGRIAKPIAQHIFELMPTIPLYLPGSLTSPSTIGPYFSQSYSPPRSPPLRANHFFRQ